MPRPPAELEALSRIWRQPSGWRVFSAVNNTYIGLMYVGAALLFLLLGGVLALLMRLQLALPEQSLVGPDLYNQLFTMHGSVMMFLFAVPVIEAVGVLLLPALLGARDLPFPKLSAYAFWAYLFGGLGFYASIFFGMAPDGGWFMYPPLTSYTWSPGRGADFWLLGIGFIEISAIAGAIEIIVGILYTRPPGMTLGRMPVYAWAMLVAGVMILIAFPAVILATALLELERAFHWPFFIAARGGDPLLWQHLFWMFGHPDVYIIFLPAAGLVSMIVPTIAGVRLVGYRWLVAALVGTATLSFLLWVHHMFAVGMSKHVTTFFSAASLAVAIPAAVQIFSWLATLHRGQLRYTTPAWFVLAFFGTFVLGGLTGVMVAVVPYDWQVHDTYFVVAHLHYVLIGGMVLPVFGALYYWAPLIGGRVLPPAWGKLACALMFGGVNAAFLPMHVAGLLGMPRRVWTWPAGLGFEAWNLAATIGAFIFAAGVVIAILDFILHLRKAGKVDTNPWQAGTLEWLPTDNYGVRSIPLVESREPLWDRPTLRTEVDAGAWYLPGSVTGTRETLVTSPRDAIPRYLLRLPGPGWLPLLAGAGTAAFFFALTFKLTVVAALAFVVTLYWVYRWLWETEPSPTGKLHPIGGGLSLPAEPIPSLSHARLAVGLLLLVDGIVYACLVFSFFYLCTPDWQASTGVVSPNAYLIVAGACALGSAILAESASRSQHRGGTARAIGGLLGASVLTSGALFVSRLVAIGLLHPETHARDAVLATFAGFHALHALLLVLMGMFVLARVMTGRLGAGQRASLDCLRLFNWFVAVSVWAGVGIELVWAR
jgi:cytochrome c oxidase subunit I+III